MNYRVYASEQICVIIWSYRHSDEASAANAAMNWNLSFGTVRQTELFERRHSSRT